MTLSMAGRKLTHVENIPDDVRTFMECLNGERFQKLTRCGFCTFQDESADTPLVQSALS